MAKIRAKNLIAEKVKFEFTCVLPGVTTSTMEQDKISLNEPRLMVVMNLFTDKVKGLKMKLKYCKIMTHFQS